MFIYTLIVVDHTDRNPYILNVIASYTDEQAAIKEKEWRQRTEHFYGQHFYGQYSTAARNPDRTYEIILTELITDKFTEFALGATNEQSNTD